MHQQHTLQSFKNMILSRNLDQICRKMVYFLEKSGKIAAALGALPQTPDGLWRLGAPPPDPRAITSITCCSYFFESVCSANVIDVKQEQKELRNSNSAFAPHFLLQTLRWLSQQTPLDQISWHHNNYDRYYLILE